MKAAHLSARVAGRGAVELLVVHGDDAKALAGRQSLIPLLAMRLAQPAVLVDLGCPTNRSGSSRPSKLACRA
jgi:CO/xanthine dehydrogenase FAD-binding subunit